MIHLIRTDTNKVVSKHRTAYAAGKAARKYLKQVEKNNGPGTYLPLQAKDMSEQRSLVDDRDYNLGLSGG